MIRRRTPFLAAVLALALAAPTLTPVAAFAGGHVDIRPGALPSRLEAGKPVAVAFAMAYPNGEAVTDAAPTVVATLGRDRVEFPSRPGKRAGEYVADILLPRGGNWKLVVDSKICGNTCTLPAATVLAARVGAAKQATASR